MEYKFGWEAIKWEKDLSKIVKYLDQNGAYFKEIDKTLYYFIPEIQLPEELTKNLIKPWYEYAHRLSVKILTEKEFKELKERERRKEEERLKEIQKKQEEEKRKAKEAVECLRQEYGKAWKDYEWIRKNIGEYCTEEPMWQYFWTLIGNNWQVVDWRHNIKIEESTYNKIRSMTVNGYKGSTFLGRSFKNKKGYSCRITETYKIQRQGQHYGVYGLYKNDELIYIGSTIRDFEDRRQEHIEGLKAKKKELYVYSLLDTIDMRVIIDCSELKVNKKLNIEDVESMELALITLYKPEGNLAGRTTDFKYHGY